MKHRFDNAFRKQLCAAMGLLVALLGAAAASAQTTAGVPPPNVDPGLRLLQYRIAYEADNHGMVQRVHYDHSLNGDVMLRGLVQSRKTSDRDVDLDFFQGELFWDLGADGQRWRTGLRFDLRIRSEGRPGLIGVHWMNRWALADDWDARVVLLNFLNVGQDAPDGIFMQTRASLHYLGFEKTVVGVEMFSSYGSTDNFADFDDQRHTIGPSFGYRLSDDFIVFGGPLFGLTDATPDTDWRLWLTRTF